MLLLLLLALSVDYCGQTIISWAEVSRANVERLIKNKEVSVIVADGSTRYTCSAVGSVRPASIRAVTFLHKHSSFSPSSLCIPAEIPPTHSFPPSHPPLPLLVMSWPTHLLNI